MKCKITFLGSDEKTPGEVKSITWEGGPPGGIKFKVDEPVEFDTDDPVNGELNKQIIQRAQGNRFYRVETVPSDTATPTGRKSPVDPEPVTNIDHSKEAMHSDPILTEEEKKEHAKRDAAGASGEAVRSSRAVAHGKPADDEDKRGIKK